MLTLACLFTVVSKFRVTNSVEFNSKYEMLPYLFLLDIYFLVDLLIDFMFFFSTFCIVLYQFAPSACFVFYIKDAIKANKLILNKDVRATIFQSIDLL